MDEIARSGQIEEYGKVHRKALEVVKNPNLDVVMSHYPIPHPYGIYSRSAQALTLSTSASYLDNLALADRVVGELRTALQSAGLGDRTAIILSSDHSLRDEREAILPGKGRPDFTPRAPGMGRIPFLVMIPGGQTGRDYTRHVNTVVTSHLVSALAQDRVRTLDEVEAWLRCGSE
jgi:membrane-anchored protein YejM (alkaline phosphatase superfamily)